MSTYPSPSSFSSALPRPWYRKQRPLLLASLIAMSIFIGACAPSDESNDIEQLRDLIEQGRVNDDAGSAAAGAAPGDAPNDAEVNEANAVTPEPEPGPETQPEVLLGTRETPFAFNTPSEVVLDTYGDADGSVWSVTVGSLTDATDRVLDSNQFNETPPEGVVFAAFPVSMELLDASKVPLSTGYNLDWEIFGIASSTVYESSTIDGLYGCGVFNAEFNEHHEAYIGGVLTGEICIPLPVVDFEDAATQIALVPAGGDRVMFAADGTPADAPRSAAIATDVGTGTGDGTRQAPIAFDASTEFKVDDYGDLNGSVWSVSVSVPRDITTEVLAENSYNDEPLDGYMFAGFEVTLTLVSSDIEPVGPGSSFDWEILGGTSNLVHSDNSAWCGVVPSEIDMHTEILAGGVLTGTACVVIPVEDFDAANTQVALNHSSGERVVFG